jgi:2-succinyl-5-enolpyruvyl-6-hydroxy-3-cyclohexene-1-carboxylate synthase
MHRRQHIADLPVILRRKGVRHVIVSPGSRNAPLIQCFYAEFGASCISIVDERSAAYTGLGIASFTKVPVVLLCTSGTAALNYAPALAEAFYLGVPLIAITADRPPEWIDQQDNQTIRQNGIYARNIRAAFSFPVDVHDGNETGHAHRIINEAYNIAASGRMGPVHINIPLREPLYDEMPHAGDITCIHFTEPKGFHECGDRLGKVWQEARKILIVCGQMFYSRELCNSFETIGMDERVCIIGEPASNIRIKGTIVNPDPVLALKESDGELVPDLLIYFGGPIVSNRLKQFLRNSRVQHCWFIDQEGRHIDTFKKVTEVIKTGPQEFFQWLESLEKQQGSGYKKYWLERENILDRFIQDAMPSVAYSDLGIVHRIAGSLPEDALLFAGNSSIIRYLGFFKPKCLAIYANRGTSGIDGCVSTAAGIAMATDKLVFALVGDQSFVYDSNALWNRALPGNLKIIVINNQGGNIFSLIDGPSSWPVFKDYLEAHHPVHIEKLADAFGVAYLCCRRYDDFEAAFKNTVMHQGPVVLEILTPREVNPPVFRTFVDRLKKLL